MNKYWSLAFVAATFAVGASARADTTITLNCFLPPQHVTCTTTMPTWAKNVETATHGRVKVTQFPTNAAPPPDQLSSVRAGVFDVGLQYFGFIQNQIPVAFVAMMPFTGGLDSEATSVALWRTYEKFGAGLNEFKGVKLLGFVVSPGLNFYSTTDSPITTLDDLRHRKIYAIPGAIATTLRALGSPIVAGPSVKMTEFVQNGVVDGFIGAAAGSIKAYGLTSYVRSVTRTDRSLTTAAFVFAMNQEKWDSLSAQDQKAIMSVSGEAFTRMAGKAYRDWNQPYVVQQSKTLQVVQASRQFQEGLEQAAQPYIKKWLEAVSKTGVDGAAELAFYKKTVAELEAENRSGSNAPE